MRDPKRLLIGLLTGSGLVVVIWMAIVYGTAGGPGIKPADVSSVEIRLYEERDQKPLDMKSDEQAKIGALLTVLGRGAPTNDHKCASSGKIKVRLKGGEEREFGILAGHHAEFYEYRYYKPKGGGYDIFKVDRAAFLKAMAGLGVTGLDAGRPE